MSLGQSPDGDTHRSRPDGPDRLTWHATAVLATLPFLVLVAVHWSTLPLVEMGDYAQYLLHAQALLDGRPYAETGYIFDRYAANTGPPAYPPGFPLTLVAPLALFGRHWAVLKLVVVGSALAFLVIAFRELTVRGGAWLAAGATAIAGVAVESVYGTNAIMSDLGFAALAWATISAADTPARWSRRRTAMVAALGLAAMSYRLAGIALLPALLAFTLVARHRVGLRPLLAVAGWTVAVAGALAYTDLTAQFPQTVFSAPDRLLLRLSINVPIVIAALSEALLYPVPWDLANEVYHIVGAVLVAVGAVDVVRHQYRAALFWFAVSYLALLLLAPASTPRYWWPLHPVTAYLLLSGLARALRWLTRTPSAPARRLAAGCGVVIAVAAAIQVARRPTPPTLLGTPDVQSLFVALRTTHEARGLRVYFMQPRVLTWETGIPAMPYIRGPGPRVLAELRRHRISDVIVGDLGIERASRDTLAATIARHPAAFEPTYRNASFSVYRFMPEQLGDTGGDTRRR